MLIIFLLTIIVVFLLFRYGVFVLDRNVFKFQINPILKKGVISNLRDFKIVHNYIEMCFERDPDKFERDPDMKKLDKMMGAYYDKTS
ncbi:hypothetical protein Marme_2790 [Marinomonas mediterranea MMB-1]|jgi:hypothetical protein|uniref:Uncharacterized protein n=1 Tax=Marinomonas mediterranea (strain ATCC 700492 / JCM 21426 / NBRC 103028 / MMB-1) TaxID=717774 RepID=F2JZ37_MARM1|nr:hypothetical protein Marme_2790 [Marinomonas mediterranea MMB-1]